MRKAGVSKRIALSVCVAALLAGGAVTMSACSHHSAFPAGPLLEAHWLSLKESSYAAADALSAQAMPGVNASTPILVGTLSDINEIETSSALGRMITEQIGARFVQLGYTVNEIKLRTSVNVRQTSQSEDAGEYLFSRLPHALTDEQKAGAIISGTYAVARDSVLINVRLVEASTGKVVAAEDYGIKMTPDVAKLLSDGESEFFSSGWPQR